MAFVLTATPALDLLGPAQGSLSVPYITFGGNAVAVNVNNSEVARQEFTGRINDGQVRYTWIDYNGTTQQLEVRSLF